MDGHVLRGREGLRRNPDLIRTLDGASFAGFLQTGAMVVQDRRELLNRINVFPVADADTGHNLALTLRAAIDKLGRRPPAGVGEAARMAADGALDGARGNAGTIFAQFLHGFADAANGLLHLDPPAFSRAASSGARAAYLALGRPREGTILSVLRAWADAVAGRVEAAGSLAVVLQQALETARQALARTPSQLEILRRAGVVDAGGQGFVYFLEGAVRFVESGASSSWKWISTGAEPVLEDAAGHADFSSPYRYCTEALVTGQDLERGDLVSDAEGVGDSLVVAGGGDKMRLHLHTNMPRRLFERLSRRGFLARCKVDDMRLQHPESGPSGTAVVTDSTCDLPERVDRDAGVYHIPLGISIDDQDFRDGVDLAPAAFYQRMRRSSRLPKTTQPPVGAFVSLYRRLLERHESIVSVHIAASVSGTCEAARAAAQRVAPERILVVDSRQVSVGLGLLVEFVTGRVRQGDDLEQIAATAGSLASQVRVFGSTPSLEHAVRGGRVDARVAWVLERLGVKPIVDFDESGKPYKGGTKIGFSRAMDALVERARRFASQSPVRAMVVHADHLDAGRTLAARAAIRLGLSEVPVLQAGAVLGTHVGPGAVALAVRRGT